MTKTQENNLCRDIGRIARSLERIANALEKANDHDKVEIVQCKDCKNWNFQDVCGVISNEKAVLRTGFNFYCGYGERKE